MKIQQLSFICPVLLCCFLSIYGAKAYDNQQHTYTMYTSKELQSLYAPIIFSSSGIKEFFTTTFNRAEYASEVLPNDFSHLVQLLERSLNTFKRRCAGTSLQQAEARQSLKKARIYAKGVLRIFKNKIHSCSYISAYAFDKMLVEVAQLLELMMRAVACKDTQEQIESTCKLLYDSFSEKFMFFKRHPHEFLMDLSCSIVDQLHEYYTPEVDLEGLRSIFVRFLEVGLTKLVWHPHDGVNTWVSVKSLAEHMADFVEHGIIEDTEDLNDLYISLLERYMFFLDISSERLPLSFYRKIKEDIANNPTILLDLEEQEAFLESKLQRFVNALNVGEARALARQMVV